MFTARCCAECSRERANGDSGCLRLHSGYWIRRTPSPRAIEDADAPFAIAIRHPVTSRPHLAYVFERFPTFTQTFCVREILELERIGVRPIIFSIHDTRGEDLRHYPPELLERVHFLPPEDLLI